MATIPSLHSSDYQFIISIRNFWHFARSAARRSGDRTVRNAYINDFQALDVVPAQICVLDQQGLIRYVNRRWRQFAGDNAYAGGDFEGVSYLSICAAADGVEAPVADSFGRRLKAMLSEGREKEFSVVYPCHAPSARRWFKATAQAVDNGAVVAHTDITDEYSRLERESQLLTSAGLIHDLRSPLNAVIGFADLSLQIVRSDERARALLESLRHIRQAGGRMLELVNELLDYAADAHGCDQAREEPVSLERLTREVVALSQVAADRSGVRITFSNNASPQLLCNERAIWKLLQNLVSNAVKYNRPNGEVRIFTDVNRSGGVELIVQDSGIGMPSDRIGAMFSPFVRADSVRRNDDVPGAGLGLALVREIALRHDGMLRVSSAEGAGASVAAVFPSWRTIAP